MKGTFERTGLSLPLDGSEDEARVRFDGKAVDKVQLEDSEESSDHSMVLVRIIVSLLIEFTRSDK